MKSAATLAEFITANRGTIYRFMLAKMRPAIKNNESEVILFKLGASNRVAKIKKQDFEQSLMDMMTHFIATEEYERVVQCRNLLNLYYINRIVEET